MDGRIARSVLDTRKMAPGTGVALFRDAAQVLYEFQPLDSRSPAHLCFDAYQVGDVVVDSFWASGANAYERSRSRIGRDQHDCLVLQLLLDGHWSRRDGACEATVGDLVILDMAQPQSMIGSDRGTLHLWLPRRLVASRLRSVDEHNMRVISGSSPLARLFSSHLHLLYKELGSMTEAEAQAALSIALDLAAATIDGVKPEYSAAMASALVEQIRQYIDTCIVDPALSAQSIATHFGISRRKLYYLFEPSGGLAGYIQGKRLHLVRAALSDPGQRRETVADIATRHGFLHYRSFSRAFERQFGISPRAMRTLALSGEPRTTNCGDVRLAWAAWLNDLQ
ncbi:MAG: helix-turn-helix domain-containing protein [Neoaquamicrobium sediminum]|uniref:helix-turn-helix domain-containing protein n=1 Tax=Neoaquamicrobium sediminum TaxID=1849104 RepID=UPI00403735DC